MSAKHTPGPWETLTFSNHELQTDFAMVKIGSRAHMVGCSEEDKANARLIAAAPELLEALKTLRDALDPDDWMGELTMHDFIDLAIAKAANNAK